MQPAAQRYFGSRVVEITQIASYGCRGRNGNNYGNISEHAFGNALDMAAFRLANGQNIVVVNAWGHGTAREQAFLQAVFAEPARNSIPCSAPAATATTTTISTWISWSPTPGMDVISPAIARPRAGGAGERRPEDDGLDQADPIHRPCAQLTEKLQLWPDRHVQAPQDQV